MRYSYKAAGREIELEQDPDFVAVRFKEPAPHSVRARVVDATAEVGDFAERFEVPEVPLTVIPVAQTEQPRAERAKKAMVRLSSSPEVARVSPVFRYGDLKVVPAHRVLAGYSDAAKAQALFAKYGGTIARKNGDEYEIELEESRDPLAVAPALAKEPGVTYAEPDFVTFGKHVARRARGPRTAAAPLDADSQKQYAIRITDAVSAWNVRRGDPSVIIAILDEGVDTRHEDLAAAVVGSFDGSDNDTFQEPNAWDGHGTACAGLAAAVHNATGVQGIGGGCSLQAVRIAFSASAESDWTISNSWIARAIDWAWQNGASILSNSWGGGAPSTAVTNAFERARTQGRGGKGCVIVVAAGNASSSVLFPGNLPNVLTVSASNEFDEFKTKSSRDGETWWGSNFGPEVDVAAPGVHNWTTDISGGAGYATGGYTDFNGTSSATPIVAGACGLVLSLNPSLTEAQVRQIIKDSADKVGPLAYTNGRNDQFGSGRLNCRAALQLAMPAQTQATYTAIHRAIQTVPLPDLGSAELGVSVGDDRPIRDLKVHVDIAHTYIGDLEVTLVPPPGPGSEPILLHSRTGQGTDNIQRTFDAASTPKLAALRGRSLPGTWLLKVKDLQGGDEGAILSFAVELALSA
ncbi:MAG TPA: S8 family serine peptidase [Polyangiaceae bacterium]